MSVFYPNHEKELYQCKKCGWSGTGKEALMGDEYAAVGFELDCPVCPGIEEVGFVEFPFLEDVAKNGTGLDKIVATQRVAFLEELEQSQLKHPNQLPDIDCWQLSFVMQISNSNGKDYLVITCEGNQIWKELYHWEFYQRFLDIGEILIEKYGRSLMDFIPDVDWVKIYGDSISAASKVHDFRIEIIEKHRFSRDLYIESDYGAALQELVDEERRKNPKSSLDRWLNKFEKRIKELDYELMIYQEEKKRNAILKKLAAEERRINPKNFLDRWINKFEQWKKPIND